MLRSGNHALINSWRLKQSLKATLALRPDLLSAEQKELLTGRLPYKMKNRSAASMRSCVPKSLPSRKNAQAPR